MIFEARLHRPHTSRVKGTEDARAANAPQTTWGARCSFALDPEGACSENSQAQLEALLKRAVGQPTKSGAHRLGHWSWIGYLDYPLPQVPLTQEEIRAELEDFLIWKTELQGANWAGLALLSSLCALLSFSPVKP